MNLVKRFFVFALMLTTVASMSAIAPNVRAAGNYDAGSLLALEDVDGSAVYYIGSDGMKYVFPDPKTYSTWYENFDTVVRVSVTELDLYPDGGAITYRPGTKLITHANTNNVYAVTPGGAYCLLPSEAVAIALYGADWTSMVQDVIPGFFSSSYTNGACDLSDTLSDGTVVMMGETYYYIVDGTKRPFASADAFEANNFVYDFAMEVDDLAAYADGSSITGEEEGLAGYMSIDVVVVDPEDPVYTGGLSVSLASDTPNGVGVIGSNDGTLYAKFNVTANSGDAVVTGMQIARTGLGSYDDFSKVWLVVDGVRHGSVKSLNSADEANILFSADTNKVTITNGTTKVFELWASMTALTSGVGFTSGAYNGLGIAELSTEAAVTGLPVNGNALGNVSAEAPDVTLESASIGNSADVGDDDVIVAKFKVDNDESNETAIFEGITFKSITKSGTTRAYTSDFTNFRLYDNSGNVVAGPIEMGSDNYLRFALDVPFVIEEGTSKYEWFYVKADVADGADRTLNLSVEGMYDVAVYGGTNMYHADVLDSYTDANEYVTLSASDLSVTVDTAINPTATDVDQNDTIVLLLGDIKATKGSVDADSFRIDLTGTDMDFDATAEFENLRLYIDDVLVSETSSLFTDTSCTAGNEAGTGETALYACFTDSFSVSGVVPFRVEIDTKDLKSGDAGTVVKATVTGSTIVGTTEADGTSVTGTGSAAGNNMTIITPGFRIYKSATPVSVTKVLGAQDIEFLGIDIKSENTTNVVVTKIKFELNASGFTEDQNDVQNIELLDVSGNVLAGPLNLDASEEVEFTGLALDVDSNGSKFILRGDIASSMNDSGNFTSGTDGLYFTVLSAEGDANNNTYNATDSADAALVDDSNEVNDGPSTIMTVGTGTLTVTAASDMPISSQLVALSTGNEVGMWKLVSANEDVQIKKFRVALTTGTAGEDEISRIALYEGATMLAETYSFAGGYTEFDITSEDFVVEPGSGSARYLTMVVDLNSTSDNVLDSGATLAGVLVDLEAWGATLEVDPISGSTADGFAFAATTNTSDLNADINSSVTTVVVDDTTGILAGDVVLIGSEQMYVVSVTNGTTFVVVRGFNGTTAAAQLDATAATDTTVAKSIEGNDFKVYGNKLVISDGATTPSGTLSAWGTYTSVYKFKLTPDAEATEEAVMNSVKISLNTATGIGATTSAGWYITAIALYDGAGTQLAADTTDIVAASGDVTFSSLAEAISTSGEEFTVKVQVALGSGSGVIETGDSLSLAIENLGGIATTGDVDWDDSVSTAVTWIDMGSTDAHVGGSFTY